MKGDQYFFLCCEREQHLLLALYCNITIIKGVKSRNDERQSKRSGRNILREKCDVKNVFVCFISSNDACVVFFGRS